jgi:hypothetical protein
MTDELREAFEELRAHERRNPPEFERLLMQGGVRSGTAGRAWRVQRGATSVAGAAAGVLLLVLLWPRPMEVVTAPHIGTGPRATADTIIVPPVPDLMAELPDLHESILNFEGAP